MKILIGLVVLALLGAGGLFLLAQKSKSGTAPGLENGRLAPCPSSPNCLVSEDHADDKHRTQPLPLAAWEQLPQIIAATGGEIKTQQANYIAAEYSTSTMGFVDDVEFRLADDAVHVRSASRVGYGDAGANAKRVAEIRKALAG